MTDINNNYKRFQTYNNDGIKSNQNTLKQNYMEQNYRADNKPLKKNNEIGKVSGLSKPDNSFLQRSTRIGVNNQGNFFRK